MKGSEAQLLDFMEGTNNRFVIPVYQRKYDWKRENCKQLYDDLKKLITEGRSSHFFGSIVSQVVPNGSKIEFYIIDGQQRLTTVTLLLLAICNLIRSGQVKSKEPALDEQLMERFVIAKWAEEGDRIKLRPVKSDQEALEKLVAGDPEEFDPASLMTLNYQYFCEQIIKDEISVDDLYQAIGKLEIISITLERDDDAQLIFESLNSTGLALTEGDKIRNYILMGLAPKKQNEYHSKYWLKIENCTGNEVSQFVRDYLSIKQQKTPAIRNVYQVFKQYVETNAIELQTLLKDMLLYARLFQKLKTGVSGLYSYQLDDCLQRLKRLEITVTEPFFLEVLRLNQDGELSTEDVTKVFLITENYLFRRNICEVPSNALNKVFLTLNKETLRLGQDAEQYVDHFIYVLLSKRDSSRFPDDEEFGQALANKAVYQMQGKYKAYLFERFENFGTLETKDVYTHLENGTYSIEHIMPQHLTPAWVQSLGPDAEEIHDTWLHRLGNLTLTAYNSNMSNASFQAKRDGEKGYRKSGLRMNQRIATKENWGETELQERNDEMVARAVNEIWPTPETSFVPAEREYDACALDDETVDLTGRDIIKYRYQNVETPVASWADLFEKVVKFLHESDKSVLSELVYGAEDREHVKSFFNREESGVREPLKIDQHVYAEKNTSTMMKISILRRLFHLYDADPSDLVFYLRDANKDKAAEQNRFLYRKKYWSYALPLLKEANAENGYFDNCRIPSQTNYVEAHFAVSGCSISCSASHYGARVRLCLGKSDPAENKKLFDSLKRRQSEFEKAIGVPLEWERGDHQKASVIAYTLNDVSIINEQDWPSMAKFHAKWSAKFAGVFVPALKELTDL